MNDRPDLTRDRARRPYIVAKVQEIPVGERLIVMLEGRSIGIFNINGTFYALRNLCPHQQAPLCEGRILGTTLPSSPGQYVLGREGEILRCPWHGWEFDITTGRAIFDPKKCRVRTYPVIVESATPGASDVAVETFSVMVEDANVVVYV